MPMKDGSALFFIVIDWLEGGTLSDRLKHLVRTSGKDNHDVLSRRALSAIAHVPKPGHLRPQKKRNIRMTQTEALRIGEELSDIMRYIHDEADAKNVILHRDLKPDNIGFLSGGTVCLFDFGLSTRFPRAREDQNSDKRLYKIPTESTTTADDALPPRFNMTGHTGSIRYMAPEVAMDLPYNQSVDVYSFSIILWEMVSRRRPYEEMNVRMHRARVCENAERPCVKSTIAIADLTNLLQAGWAHNISARPAFSDIVVTLRRIRADVSSTKPKETPLQFIRKKLRQPFRL